MNAESPKVYTEKQLKANRKKWVKALRSGKYKQTGGTLYSERKDAYCCLGVLCRVLLGNRDIIGGTLFSYDAVRQAVGLSHDDGTYNSGCLATLNDNGAPFSKIADIIEGEPAGLFLPVPAKSEV